MKVLLLLALLASCRWHFDAVGTSDGASPDRPGDDAAAPMVVYATSGPNGGAPRLIEVDLATGEVTERGLLGVSYILSGLAYWDATTLYATSVTGDLVSIDLATRSTTVVRTIGGVVSSLERDNGDLIGVDEATDELVRFTPAGGVTRTPITDGATTVMAQGGDLARASDGTW